MSHVADLEKRSDIIAAVATPPGRGGIGIVRVSGKNLQPFAEAILGSLPKPRYACFSKFYDENEQVIDQGIALYFPAPHSYTGEDILELQGHGGPVIMNLLMARCLSVGARLAQPGEFTLRAYLNNKLDLVQAESVADIIEASTSEAARCAMRSLQGAFSATIGSLVRHIIELRIIIEATLDFPEEEIDILQSMQVDHQLVVIQDQLEQVLIASRQGSLLQEGIKVVLVGQPNVGKSSLMNQLAEEEIAIVTEIPGTTRDTIQQTIKIEGVPIHIIDTAGLRKTDDIVEKKGIERTQAAIQKADMLLLLLDSNATDTSSNHEILNNLPASLPRLIIYNKIDLLHIDPGIENKAGQVMIHLSAKTGAGITLLRQKLLEMVGWQSNNAGEGLFMARQRHLQALMAAKTHLENARLLMENNYQLELLAEELRCSQTALATITGEFTADDLLGEIFSHFCIGK